jgi:serine/threonine-protein kinase
LVAAIIRQCCAGLHAAHELRSHDGRLLDVVHRDVSPPNIFITTEGVVKLLDFGVAKARGASQKTRTGTVKGKNAYMSPEQVLGEQIDRRSDLFSLGIVMWESLTASRLFLRDTDFETFRAITRGDLPDVASHRADLPPALAEVVRCALERDRDRRYASSLDLAAALDAAVEPLGGPSSDPELASYLHQHFSKELGGKQELLELASAPEDARGRRMTPAVIDLQAPSRPTGRMPLLPQPSEEEDDDEVTVARPRPPAATTQKLPVHPSAARPRTARWLPVLAVILVALGLAAVVLYGVGLL